MSILEPAAPESPSGTRFGARKLSASHGLRTPFAQIQHLYARARESGRSNLLDGVLEQMQVTIGVPECDLSRIPATGPTLLVCSRSLGMLESTVLGALIQRSHSDYKVLSHGRLRDVEALDGYSVYLDAFGNKASIQGGIALEESKRWLERGGLLVTFPPLRRNAAWRSGNGVATPQWEEAVAALVRCTRAVTVPVHFEGRNNPALQGLNLLHPNLVHPNLRPALLLNDFLAQRGRTVHLRIGRAIPAATIISFDSDAEATHYLRWRTHLLAHKSRAPKKAASALRPRFLAQRQERLTLAVAPERMMGDVDALRPVQILEGNREFTVFAAREHEIPNILPELGRLREVTFRDAGEGTGRSSDLDEFDSYYTHIVLWNKLNHEAVGAYRIGDTARILPRRGIDGLYTSTLFRFDDRFFDKLGPALELGRSFIRPEYQRHYAPLLLLWKGIACYVAAHPETPTLFGAVSISGRYSRASRELMVRFFESRRPCDELSPLVQPRRPFRPGRIQPWDCRTICHAMRELDEIADPIADMESDGKGIPILIKHYHRLGGRLLGFNVDAKFSGVLDGLVVMDLRQTQPSALERYMGKSGLADFRRYHGLPALHNMR